MESFYLFQHQLNLIRTHTRYLARSDWYDWKLQWVEGLRVTADEAFVSLENVCNDFSLTHSPLIDFANTGRS
jgi:hypothetical protein